MKMKRIEMALAAFILPFCSMADTHTGQEVDFVIYGENLFDAIEVKNTDNLSPKDFSGLKSFADDYPEAQRIMLYRGKERLLRNGVMCIPVDEYLKSLKP